MYGDSGTVRCGTEAAGDTLCFRSDQAQRLLVAVDALTSDPARLATTTNQAWAALGGR